jgi:hypothetical protein
VQSLVLASLIPVLTIGAESPAGAGDTVAKADDDVANATDPDDEYGPFFEGEAPSDTQWATQPNKRRTPVLSVGDGAFCFVEGTFCKASLILNAGVAVGMRIPSSEKGPDLPYAQFTFQGGLAIRPMMLGGRREWHPWGLGVVSSWSRGTGSVTVEGDAENQEVESSDRTDVFRIGAINQLWLTKKRHGLHLDFSLGAVQADVLTSGVRLWGTSAEVAMNFGGWGGMYLAGDFLDEDTRVVFGFRGHGIAAGPIIAMAIAGLALGGAM